MKLEDLTPDVAITLECEQRRNSEAPAGDGDAGTPDMAKKPRTPDEAYAEALRRIEDCRAERGTYLNLSILRLSSLPPEIGQLTALTALHLYNNKLSSLPPEIGQLTALTTLCLDKNQLSTLPTEIGQLTALSSLFLNNNQLSTLPPELGRLPPTMTLFLHGNPGLQIPESVLGVILAAWDMRAETAPKSGPILDYYFRTRQPAE